MIISESSQEQYLTQLSNGAAGITADTVRAKDGSEYFGPHDLLCAGFATCLNITVRMVLERRGLAYEKVIVKVDVDRSQEDSTIFLYDVDVIGDMDADAKEAAIAKASNCPVRKTLSKNISFRPMGKAE